MNSAISYLKLAGISLLLTGCASTDMQGMYWGGYAESLYQLEDNGDDRSRAQHIVTLQRIIDGSERRGWRVPPGVYLELAVLQQQQGNSASYEDYINRELELYPESQRFIERWLRNEETGEPPL